MRLSSVGTCTSNQLVSRALWLIILGQLREGLDNIIARQRQCTYKACKCYLVPLLNRIPIFNWYVVQWGSKSKHRKDTCLKEIELHLQLLVTITHSIMNTIGRTYVFSWGVDKCNHNHNHNQIPRGPIFVPSNKHEQNTTQASSFYDILYNRSV